MFDRCSPLAMDKILAVTKINRREQRTGALIYLGATSGGEFAAIASIRDLKDSSSP